MAKFYGLGVGPGDPELLTLKAIRVLKEVDIIIAPEGKKDSGSVALNIIKPHLNNLDKVVTLTFPMTYNDDDLTSKWVENAIYIKEQINQNRSVAFITLGDPMLYSTYMYMIELLKKHDIEIETVPGINSFSALASVTNIPLTEGEETLCVIPLRTGSKVLSDALDKFDNVIVMKPSGAPEQVAKELQERNLEDNFVMVTKCGTEEQVISRDINDLINKNVPYLTTLLIKKNNKRM